MDITVTYVAREVKTANALDTLLSIVALKYLILLFDCAVFQPLFYP